MLPDRPFFHGLYIPNIHRFNQSINSYRHPSSGLTRHVFIICQTFATKTGVLSLIMYMSRDQIPSLWKAPPRTDREVQTTGALLQDAACAFAAYYTVQSTTKVASDSRVLSLSLSAQLLLMALLCAPHQQLAHPGASKTDGGIQRHM